MINLYRQEYDFPPVAEYTDSPIDIPLYSESSYQIRQKRNFGIDLLRIISMLYVLILHVLGQGGVLKAAEASGDFARHAAWFAETWTYGAVDIFALISGYVSYRGYQKKSSFTSWFRLWFQIVFYSIILTLGYSLFMPEAVEKFDYIRMFLPLSTDALWYFTAYTGLMIFRPFIDAGLRSCQDSSLKKLVVAMILVFAAYDNNIRILGIRNGYSFIWLIILYIIGASVRKCGIGKNLRGRYAFLWIVLLNASAWALHEFAGEITFLNGGIKLSYVDYTSVFVVVSSILYVILFSKINLNGVLKKITVFAAPCAFSAYILNNNKYIWRNFMYDRFTFLGERTPVIMLMGAFLFAAGFLAASVFIDKLREYLFKILRIDRLCVKLNSFIEKFIGFVSDAF